ncbi:hypothetical protein Pmar_PMAR010877 [Perkinsus marinus ATCC 50983]|uniref:Uncharacterized protein n=1 Tax=Perkinsus marinus (strain ATCC 50983 / TXsc) TaxID=423536 RepID=C5LU82_PERM5|nr:hypothetical protein Pmar_PMAR010877 [Perkinsus marinus ATCC 50983]EEQ99615.1 hypothetical protein Pmar_PMAR010877 [Perkinsus marinus ATCC 50983]|eukprot:XP_002766898.1 hypothetical protein Pmar_PMAR010877 [Perkinsus marinus ATCC 50983]
MVVPPPPQRGTEGPVLPEAQALKANPVEGRGRQATISESTSPASVSRPGASTNPSGRELSPLTEERSLEIDERVLDGPEMRKDSSTEDHMKRMRSGSSNIMVAVRTRSLLPFEKAQGGREVLRVLENKAINRTTGLPSATHVVHWRKRPGGGEVL